MRVNLSVSGRQTVELIDRRGSKIRLDIPLSNLLLLVPFHQNPCCLSESDRESREKHRKVTFLVFLQDIVPLVLCAGWIFIHRGIILSVRGACNSVFTQINSNRLQGEPC